MGLPSFRVLAVPAQTVAVDLFVEVGTRRVHGLGRARHVPGVLGELGHEEELLCFILEFLQRPDREESLPRARRSRRRRRVDDPPSPHDDRGELRHPGAGSLRNPRPPRRERPRRTLIMSRSIVVLQLAYVPRPRARRERLERGIGETLQAIVVRCARKSSAKCATRTGTSSGRSASGGVRRRERLGDS